MERRLRGSGAAFLAFAAATFCALVALSAAAAEPVRVVLISLDGTRPADITRESVPSLVAAGERGAVALRLIPSIPANTFPSHVTLVTGVAPELHGLVNNVFLDPERGVFEKEDIATWIEVEPLWSLLAAEGIPSASYYWVGSEEPWRSGRGPRWSKKFSSRTGEEKKVEQILAWLDLPADESPHFITSWFHGADHAGHRYGVGSEAVQRSLQKQDLSISRLIDGIGERELWPTTTLIFVSDHGMVGAERRLNLTKELKAVGIRARVFGIGGFATVDLGAAGRRDAEIAERAVARAREVGLQAHLRARAPADWRVGHVRFADVVVRAPVGTAIVYGDLDLAGYHGYDPAEPSMASIFMAIGRGVASGTRLPVVHSVDVAPTVLALFGLKVPAWMEGRPIASIVPPPHSSATLDAPSLSE
ncbi:MAG: alkaline phosphatase family protein [Deltaproteobacteria bacterium]|nr:alkaline phosphatase family protein [Deltaproteobacteria bacterium]MBW2384027.1 alkaline phosphatase family protein [Deltaproteobacteria bacterium]